MLLLFNSACNLLDISSIDADIQNNFQTRYISLHQYLKYNDAFEDIFDKVVIHENVDSLYIPKKLNKDAYSISNSLVIKINKTNGDGICAVIDNTKDNPNDFNLKLWNGNKKLAASSKKIDELKKLCKVYNIDIQSVNRKNEVCKLLISKLLSMNRILPWSPVKAPSLYRIYLVAKAWECNTVCDMITQIVNNIIENKGSIFVNAVLR